MVGNTKPRGRLINNTFPHLVNFLVFMCATNLQYRISNARYVFIEVTAVIIRAIVIILRSDFIYADH